MERWRALWTFICRYRYYLSVFSAVGIVVNIAIFLLLKGNHFVEIFTLEFAVATLALDVMLHLKTEEIALAATTRYLAHWPKHLGDLTNLISGTHADDEICILLDFFAYGHFTNPEGFKEYFAAILHAIQDKEVRSRILVCAESEARACTIIQFKEDPFPEFLKEKKVRKWLENYKSILKGHEPQNFDEFIDALLYLDDHFCHELAWPGRVTIRTLPSPLGQKELESWMQEVIYCWIVPSRGMIFSFPNFYGARSGHSFQTRDMSLIATFQHQFEQKFKSEDTKRLEPNNHVYPDAYARVQSRIADAGKLPSMVSNHEKV